MVKSQLAKSTFREIKSSMGRFLAILSIIGLGVGFFAGLKIAREAMVATVEGYLREHTFYDYRLLSTLGFDGEGVDYLNALEDVAAAEGSLSFDVLYRLESLSDLSGPEHTGSQGAVKTHSLTERLNTVKLLAGRMPENDNECVADANLLGEEDLGSVLVLSEENDEETLEHFTWRQYNVVGIVQSPLYLQYERGNTSLGTGRLAGFVYLLPQGYAEDYYTEIYVSFAGDFSLYSDEYKAYIDQVEKAWEDYEKQAADLRYQSILADAYEELDEAKQEFEEKKAEGEAELADAAATLADAEEQLADGEQALADAYEELADGEKTLAEKERELRDAMATLAEKEQEFADGEKALQDGVNEWNDSSAYLNSSQSSLEAAAAQVAAQRVLLAEAQEQMLDALKQQEILSPDAGPAELQKMISDMDASLADLEEALDTLTKDNSRSEAEKQDEYAYLNQKILGVKAQLKQFEPYRQDLQEYLDGEAQLSAAEARISAGFAQINDGKNQLAAAWMEIQDAAIELEKGRQALEDARVEIADGEKALEDAKKELADARVTLEEKTAELEDAQAEYEDGLQEYLDAQAEFDEKIADAQAQIDDAEAELADLKEPDTYLLGRDTNVGYVCFENDSGIVEGIANIFPAFFILVAVLVCITTMNRMVEEQRTQIGVLKAIGYGEGAIMSKYMIYSGLASVVGCVVGFFLGTWAFPNVIWAAYGIMYRAEDLVYVLDWKMAVFCLAVAILCSVGTTWFSCRVELSQVAAQLMRPKAPKAGKRVFLERIPVIWNRLSFLRKVSFRNIFRYKKRLFMMIVGISGCTALLVTGFGIKDSIADIATMQFEKIQIFDLGVALQDPADAATEEDFGLMQRSGVEDYLCVMEKNMDLVTDAGVKSIYLIAGEPGRMPDFLDLHTGGGDKIPYPGQGECVISDKLSAQYGILPGDTVLLRDDKMRELHLTVAAVSENYIYNYVHISEATWENQMKEATERKTVYVNVQTDVDVHEMAAALMQLDNVSNVTVNQDTMDRIGSMMASLNIIVVAVIISAAGLAFIVLYNLTNINITERIREIATIKVLGFYKKETQSYVFRENLILSVLGMLLGLVLGKWLHGFVMHEVQIDMISFIVYIKPISYVYSGLLTIGFAWFVGKAMGGKLENISMTESLKSVD